MKTDIKKMGLIGGISGAIIVAFFVVAFLLWPAHQFTLDVNPSLEITTNRLERVTNIKALNEDGKEFLEGYKMQGRHLEIVINDLVDRMILTGHISGGQDNIVMITVKNDDLNDAYVEKVNEAIAALLENRQLEYMIINQALGDDDDHPDISRGKLILIQKLINHNENLSFDELAKISLQDLLVTAEQMNLSPEELFDKFTRSHRTSTEIKDEDDGDRTSIHTTDVIGMENAIEIALDYVGGGVVKEFDYDRDDGEYEIEIKYNGREYELEIDAYTGEILEFGWKLDDDNRRPRGTTDVIGRDKAIAIALAKVGGGVVVEFEYDWDDGEYEIEIKYNGREYELEIDAYTGEIFEFGWELDDDDRSSSSGTTDVIGRDKAIKIGLAKVGGGFVVEFEYDRGDGEYEIEIKYNGREYELKIDAYTGEILEFEWDDDDRSSSSGTTDVIGRDKAIKIGLAKVGGGFVVEFEYDRDDGEYEIEIKFNGREYELKIDAYTGEILEFEIDD